MSDPEPTLTEKLASMGYTHGPRDYPGWQGRKVVDSEGKVVFEGAAHQCWAWIREGAVPGQRPARESW